MKLLSKDKKEKLHFGEILTGKFNEMCRGIEDLKILNSEKSYLNNIFYDIDDFNNFSYKMSISTYDRENFISFLVSLILVIHLRNCFKILRNLIYIQKEYLMFLTI